ncbi:uncharacterized protein LOC122530864 [Frieseomelitta varia]|uniref:uncharacterized protein LOC122530864 n=1 Tax=Frieseomelitta varia TaxID=561572 RepID=UPI001CB6A778|nr:uncharacterized protein LOC122530864 [Frieseomelitta varia]
MATMRNTMIIIVFQIIQYATSQPLATDTVNSLIPEPTHESSTYECLFIDPNLPICDPKLVESEEELSDKDTTSDKETQRSKRNADISTKDVIVYTVEGCLPSIMPVSLPSCEGISFSRIIDVQRFRPFMIKKLTKPPLVFPTIDYPQWLRMVKRIKNRASKI